MDMEFLGSGTLLAVAHGGNSREEANSAASIAPPSGWVLLGQLLYLKHLRVRLGRSQDQGIKDTPDIQEAPLDNLVQ